MRRRKLQYNFLTPPVNKPFSELTHSETVAYFQWFVSHIQERTDYLSSVIREIPSCSTSKLDLSPESLIPLWTWFLTIAEVELVAKEKITDARGNVFESSGIFSDYISNRSEKRLSLQTEHILRDIGMYLGQVFIQNESSIKWCFFEHPKTDFYVNMPVLSGFEDTRFNPPFQMYFEPVHMATVQAVKLLKGEQREDDLYRLYYSWADLFIPRNQNM